jgi:hypothetical protein
MVLVSLEPNFNNKSSCSTDLLRILKSDMKIRNQIYFKRKSIKATVVYQHLDTMRSNHNLTFNWDISFEATIEKANCVLERLFTMISPKDNQ